MLQRNRVKGREREEKRRKKRRKKKREGERREGVVVGARAWDAEEEE